MDLIVDGVRWVLWLLCKGCFFLIDSLYNIIEPVITFDIATNSTLWDWWTILCSTLMIFTMLRAFAMILKGVIDEEYMMKMNPINIIVRIVAIAVVVAFLPMTVKAFSSFTSAAIATASSSFQVTNNFAEKQPITGNPEKDEKIKKIYEEYDGMPSQIFISSASNGKYPPYQLIDINETEGGLDNVLNGIPIISGAIDIFSGLIGADGDYVYFPDTTMLIFLIVEGVCGAYLFVLMAIQMSQRMISIGVKILISPYPISGIVNPDDRSFSLWGKLLIADLMSNFIQYLILLLVMMITSSTAIQKLGIVGQGIFFLGGMLAVLIGPGQVAQLIGGDGMGLFQTMQGFQAMATMKGITQGVGRAIGGAIGGAAALGTYGAGRAMGMKSLGNFEADSGDAPSGGGPSGEGGGPSGGGSDPWGVNANNQSNDGTNASNGIPPAAFSEPPTERQQNLAERLGVDIGGMSKGQASLALERGGASESFWSGYGNSVAEFSGGSAKGTIDRGNKTYGFGNSGHATSSGTSQRTAGSNIDGNNMYESAEGPSMQETDAFAGIQGSYESIGNAEEFISGGTSNYDYGVEGGSFIGSDNGHTPNSTQDYSYGADNNSSSTSEFYDNSGTTGSYERVSSNDVNGASDRVSYGSVSQKQQKSPPRMSREGSLARKVGDSSSRSSKAAYTIGRAAYSSAARRIMGQRSVYRGGRYIQKNTKAQTLSNVHQGLRNIRNNPQNNGSNGKGEEQ